MSEQELRDLLQTESLDVEPAERFRARLQDPAAAHRPIPPLGWLLVAALAVAALVVGGHAATGWHDRSVPSTPAGPHTEHLSLRPATHFHVTLAMDRGDRETLQVAHEPADDDSLEGGEVTLYDAGVFDPAAFLATPTRTVVDGHAAFFGDYAYTGEWGPVTTLAWPLGDGRWVTVQNFAGDDLAAVHAVERTVAHAVVVR